MIQAILNLNTGTAIFIFLAQFEEICVQAPARRTRAKSCSGRWLRKEKKIIKTNHSPKTFLPPLTQPADGERRVVQVQPVDPRLVREVSQGDPP